MRLILLAAPAAIASVAPAQAVGDWRAAPLSAGSWSYRGLADGSEAVFTDASATRRFLVKCSRATRQVSLRLASQVPASALIVTSTETQRTLPAHFDPQGFQIISELAGTDALLDGLAFSRGRFSIQFPGGVPLILPAWPELARSIEDCRL
jgi:hypothetical protein